MFMLEVFFLCEYPTLNGGERSMLATLDGVRAAGFAPAVLAPPQGPLADALAAHGVELLPFAAARPMRSRLPQSRLRDELSQRSGGGVPPCCTPTAWRWAGCRAPWRPNCVCPASATCAISSS